MGWVANVGKRISVWQFAWPHAHCSMRLYQMTYKDHVVEFRESIWHVNADELLASSIVDPPVGETLDNKSKLLTSHPTVCFKSNPLVECRRCIETKSRKVTKDLPESCGLDIAPRSGGTGSAPVPSASPASHRDAARGRDGLRWVPVYAPQRTFRATLRQAQGSARPPELAGNLKLSGNKITYTPVD